MIDLCAMSTYERVMSNPVSREAYEHLSRTTGMLYGRKSDPNMIAVRELLNKHYIPHLTCYDKSKPRPELIIGGAIRVGFDAIAKYVELRLSKESDSGMPLVV